jgi:hypothetical protein
MKWRKRTDFNAKDGIENAFLNELSIAALPKPRLNWSA